MGVTMVQAKIRYEEGSYEGEVNASKIPEGAGVFNYRGDDEHGRMCYDGDWANKAAHGYGVMKWQNGDRYEGDWVVVADRARVSTSVSSQAPNMRANTAMIRR